MTTDALDWHLACMWPHTFAAACTSGEKQPYLLYPHCNIVGGFLAPITEGNQRIIVNMPPRHSKTETGSKWAVAWFIWYHETVRQKPCRVILACFGDEFATDLGKQVRDIFLERPWLNISISQDTSAKSKFRTSGGSQIVAVGVGGSITGKGADLIVIDDPHKDLAEAYSPAKRRHVKDWYDATISTRLEPGGSIVVIQTRWHEDDLTNHLLTKHAHQEWRHLKMEALCTDPESDPLGREIGEALCPARFNADELERIRRGNPTHFQALYQQDPQSVGGGLLYPTFGPHNLDREVEIAGGKPILFSFDINVTPGMNAIVAQFGPDGWDVVHEIFKPGMNGVQCFQAFCDLYDAEGWTGEVHVYGEPSDPRQAKDHSTMFSVCQNTLNERGIRNRLMAPRKQQSILNSVMTLNEAMRDTGRRPKMRIHPRCKTLTRDFREVGVDNDGKPAKGNLELTHMSDALRYMVYAVDPYRSSSVDSGPKKEDFHFVKPW